MQDSGIDFDINSLFNSEDLSLEGQYYEPKSTIPTTSPLTEVKHAQVGSRTGLKQQLMKQKAQEEEKREQQFSHSVRSSAFHTPGISVPSSSAPKASPPSNLPPQILQVKTSLQFPTKYHVVQQQKKQIQSYLSQSVSGTGMEPVQTLPNFRTINAEVVTHSNSAPALYQESLLPMSNNSTQNVSEVENLLNDIGSLESVDSAYDDDLRLIEPSMVHLSSTNPTSSGGYVYSGMRLPTKSATSAPAAAQRRGTPTTYIVEEDGKERRRKDNHNMIERRRRDTINDRIKELGTLLPRSLDPDLRQNKGSILKASVDYIKRLQRDQERFRIMEEKQRQAEATARKTMLRIQQLELVMQAKGLTHNLTDDIGNLHMSPQQTVFAPVLPKQEPETEHEFTQSTTPTNETVNISDFMDENSSVVVSDPMLYSQPVSPNVEDDAMDYML